MSNELHINQNICVLHIELTGSDPLIWRKVAVPAGFSLGDLHDVIQCVMPWDDCHLHEFIIGNKSYGMPDPEYGNKMLDEELLTLEQAFQGSTKQIEYIYDFGDGWQHCIECEAMIPAERDMENLPACLDGAMACPPEDSGALFGYYKKLKILNDPSHDEHAFIKQWMPPDFDPEYFDLDETNIVLAMGDIGDEELDEAEMLLYDEFSHACGWCGNEIDDEMPILTRFLKMKTGPEADALKGSFTILTLGADDHDVPAFVIPDDSPAKQDGKDMAIMLCSDECSDGLHEALMDTFGGPLSES